MWPCCAPYKQHHHQQSGTACMKRARARALMRLNKFEIFVSEARPRVAHQEEDKKSRKSLGGPYAQGDQRKNQTGKQAFQGSPKRTTTTTTNGYNWDVFLIFVRFHTEWSPGRTAGSRLFKLYCYWVFEYSNFLYAWSAFGCTTNDGQTKCGSWPGNLCQRARNEANDFFEWDMLTQLHLLANHKDM